jgi:hypothetical protein
MYVDVSAKEVGVTRGKSMWCGDDAPVLSIGKDRYKPRSIGLELSGECTSEDNSGRAYERECSVFLTSDDIQKLVDFAFKHRLLKITVKASASGSKKE